jgi:phosphate transport system substrate-binding protein
MAKGLVETPYAIGMASMTVVEQSGAKVKALTLTGVARTSAKLKSGRYFLTCDFLFVVKGEPSIKKVLDFVVSPGGDRVMVANGAVPLRQPAEFSDGVDTTSASGSSTQTGQSFHES